MAPYGAIFVFTGHNKKAAPFGAAFLFGYGDAYFEAAFFFSTVTFFSTVVGVAVSVS